MSGSRVIDVLNLGVVLVVCGLLVVRDLGTWPLSVAVLVAFAAARRIARMRVEAARAATLSEAIKVLREHAEDLEDPAASVAILGAALVMSRSVKWEVRP